MIHNHSINASLVNHLYTPICQSEKAGITYLLIAMRTMCNCLENPSWHIILRKVGADAKSSSLGMGIENGTHTWCCAGK